MDDFFWITVAVLFIAGCELQEPNVVTTTAEDGKTILVSYDVPLPQWILVIVAIPAGLVALVAVVSLINRPFVRLRRIEQSLVSLGKNDQILGALLMNMAPDDGEWRNAEDILKTMDRIEVPEGRN
ncbi:MAG: hypothetical protein OXP69_23555 [Spirochaetaceae bacterium]|nr:hypothetical protein [Spirochaetaceae bacterium]